jgi:hypothetical protein
MDLDIRGVSWDCLSAVFQSIMYLCVATLLSCLVVVALSVVDGLSIA